ICVIAASYLSLEGSNGDFGSPQKRDSAPRPHASPGPSQSRPPELNQSPVGRRKKGRPLVCSVCSKSFQSHRRGDFIRHFRIHSGEKPFACPHCPYKAKQKMHLVFHERRHLEEKPFGCYLCDARFTHKYGMKRHLQAAHDIHG
ncbi:UNVERIFIED_CONTAM: hypothetical protein GTU68_023807, partial [Idotea baltica]|nr:hypothetical protein [Idotea baltica]